MYEENDEFSKFEGKGEPCDGTHEDRVPGSNGYASVGEILEEFQDWEMMDREGPVYKVDTSEPFTIEIARESTTAYKETISKKVMIKAETDESEEENEDDIVIVYPGTITVCVFNSTNPTENKLVFSYDLSDIQLELACKIV